MLHIGTLGWVPRKTDFWHKDLSLSHLLYLGDKATKLKWRCKESESGKTNRQCKGRQWAGSSSGHLLPEQLCGPWLISISGGWGGCSIYYWLPFRIAWDLPLGALTPLPLCPVRQRKPSHGEEERLGCLRWEAGSTLEPSTLAANSDGSLGYGQSTNICYDDMTILTPQGVIQLGNWEL